MNCPTCGAPNVILHKDIWECGWCGDSGFIPGYILAQRKAARERQNVWWKNAAVTTRNAARTFVDAVTRLLPTCPESKTFAWKVVLCQVSTGLIESGLWNGTWDDEVDESVIGRVFYPYRALVYDLVDISDISNSVTIEKAIRSRQPLFQSEGQLADNACGKFWELMIGQLPPYDKEDPSMQGGHLYMGRAFGGKNLTEIAIEDALCSILPLASFFAGCTGERADTRNNRYLGYFTEHWKRLRGEKVDPMDYDDSAVARIVEQFPELKDEYNSADLFNMSGSELLEDIYNTDPQRAIAMWRSLPEKQEPLSDPCRADDFFEEIDFLWDRLAFAAEDFVPLLDAMQADDVLAQMVFRSACVCDLQLKLLKAAAALGRQELAEHLYALLQSNPLPREDWHEEPDAFKALMEKRFDTEDNTPMYHYCSVQVGNNRPYAYLTAGLPVKKGDHVRVPYGKKNEPKEGVVRSVGDYTRDTAPWPPEKTKRVLEILPKPQDPVEKEPAGPKPQPIEKETVKSEVPPVMEEKKPTSDADKSSAIEAPQEYPPLKKRKFLPVLIVVAVVLVLVVGGVLLSRHSQAKRLAAWEQQYQTAAEQLATGNYKKAVELAEGVPENIAEQPALLTVAKAGAAFNTNTENSLREGIELLENAGSLGTYQKQGDKLLAELTDQLRASIYHKAIMRLRQYQPYTARPYLEELGSYKDAPTLLVYAKAFSLAQQFDSASYKQAQALLQLIPADYDGELASEIADLRDDLPDMIVEREEFEAQIAANQAQQQKPKPPQTFNSGSSTDTGPGSGHSLREDYSDPEDLYEDGDYDDLDEAWDEWEEGW